MNRKEAKTTILEDRPNEKIDLSFLGKYLGAVPTGTNLVWDFFCQTHGPDSTIAALPHDIETDPQKLRKWIDIKINPPKCSELCRKRLGGVSPFYPHGIENPEEYTKM